MPPIARPYPRFLADSPQEGRPSGRFAERLAAAFGEQCSKLAGEAGAALDPESLRWFPDRGWGGRVYMPVTGTGAGEEIEYFGHVSFGRDAEGGPTDLRASADFTDVTADDNPVWMIDLNDDVIGSWQVDAGRGGDITLVWGLPMVPGAVAATAELEGEVLDQTPIDEGRFTLLAVDAVHGFGDDLFLDVCLWDRSLRRPLAVESLYAEPEAE
jgi:hypothetical protein